MTAPTIAQRNAARTRELGKAGRIAPVPFTEGESKVRRCTSCGHITRFHWHDRGDRRFEGRPGTRWCQICAAFCPVEWCTSGRAHAGRSSASVHERRAGSAQAERVLARLGPSALTVGGETA